MAPAGTNADLQKHQPQGRETKQETKQGQSRRQSRRQSKGQSKGQMFVMRGCKCGVFRHPQSKGQMFVMRGCKCGVFRHLQRKGRMFVMRGCKCGVFRHRQNDMSLVRIQGRPTHKKAETFRLLCLLRVIIGSSVERAQRLACGWSGLFPHALVAWSNALFYHLPDW